MINQTVPSNILCYYARAFLLSEILYNNTKTASRFHCVNTTLKHPKKTKKTKKTFLKRSLERYETAYLKYPI